LAVFLTNIAILNAAERNEFAPYFGIFLLTFFITFKKPILKYDMFSTRGKSDINLFGMKLRADH
jgi:hypothetical protein